MLRCVNSLSIVSTTTSEAATSEKLRRPRPWSLSLPGQGRQTQPTRLPGGSLEKCNKVAEVEDPLGAVSEVSATREADSRLSGEEPAAGCPTRDSEQYMMNKVKINKKFQVNNNSIDNVNTVVRFFQFLLLSVGSHAN